jgi:hypothetical protein
VALSRSRTVATLALIVALAFGVASSAVLAPDADALASIATLTVVEGAVLVHHAGADLVPARVGDIVAAGDVIGTGSGASAEITYFEGSSVRVSAGTELRVESLRADRDTGDQVRETLGRAGGVVTKLIRGDSRYDVRVPSSTASVRG